jgi:hypothetical protein
MHKKELAEYVTACWSTLTASELIILNCMVRVAITRFWFKMISSIGGCNILKIQEDCIHCRLLRGLSSVEMYMEDAWMSIDALVVGERRGEGFHIYI